MDLFNSIENIGQSIADAGNELVDGVMDKIREWALVRYIDQAEVVEKQCYIQAFIPIVCKALDMEPEEAIQWIDSYEGDAFDLIIYPNSLQVSWNHLESDVDRRMGIEPSEDVPKLSDELVRGRGRYKGVMRTGVLKKLQAVPLMLDSDLVYKFEPKERLKGEALLYDKWMDKTFYQKWFFDKRGRMYDEGYAIHFQGEEYRREVIRLAEQQELTLTGRLELCRQLGATVLPATSTFLEREERGRAMIRDGFTPEGIIQTKLLNAMKADKTGILVGVDASASNIQIMSALSGCKIGMKMTNTMGEDNQRIHNYMLAEINKRVEPMDELTTDDIKDIIKPATMTHYFNSEAGPKSLMNDAQLAAFYEALDGLLPGCERFMQAVNNAWDDRETFEWTMPDGHQVKIKRFITENLHVEMKGVEFDYDYKVHGADGNYRHLAANVLHSIDAYIAAQVVERAPFDVLVIHDDYRCHPNNVERVKRLYREVLAECVHMDIVGMILRQITGRNGYYFKDENNEISDLILNSVHALN